MLSDDEHNQLLRIPTDETTFYRLYTLPPDEVDYVRRALEPHTIMDRALHLSLLKWPGTGFQLGQSIPSELASFLAKQLKLSAKAYRIGGRVSQAHTRAARDAAGFFGMRTTTGDDYESIVAMATAEAAHTDSGWKIAEAMLKGLRSAKLIIPAWSTLERAGLAGASRAKANAIQTVLEAVSADQRIQLDRLIVNDPAIGQTRLAWLRNVKESARVSHLGHVVERREFLDGIAIATDISNRITPWQLSRLVYRGNRARAQDIAEFADNHRHAVLATQVLHLHKVMSDGGVEMFNALTAGIFSDAAELNEERFIEHKDDTVDLAKAFRGLVRAIRAVEDDGVPLRTAVDSTVGWDTMLQLDGTADAFTTQTQQDVLLTVCEQFGRLSTYVPKFLATFTFTANSPKNPLLTAVKLLREMYRDGKLSLPANAPVSFMPEHWQRLMRIEGKIDRKRYIAAVAATVRDRIRSGDLQVDGTTNYRPFDEYLVPTEQVSQLAHRLPFETDVTAFLREREEYLDDRLACFAAKLQRDQLEGVRLVNGKVSITPLESTVSPEIQRTLDRIEDLMPRKRVSHLFHELQSETGVFSAFTDGQRRPHHDLRVVMAAVWATATGLGLERMAAASPGVTVGAHSGEFDQPFRRKPISHSGQSDQSDAGA